MARVISIHEYSLEDGADAGQFERAVREAEQRGLLRLPGLVRHHFVKGIRGSRRGGYAAIWVYESKEAWEKLWGPVGQPREKQDYPESWKVWEDEVLAPFLGEEPDEIEYTAYEEF